MLSNKNSIKLIGAALVLTAVSGVVWFQDFFSAAPEEIAAPLEKPAAVEKNINLKSERTPLSVGMFSGPKQVSDDKSLDQRDSWKIELAPGQQYPRRITSLGINDPVAAKNAWEASQGFIDRHARDLFQLDPRQLKTSSFRVGAHADELRKVVYAQEIDGIPVINSRFAFFYDASGSLLEVQANIATELAGAKVPHQINSIESAQLAAKSLRRLYEPLGIALPADLSERVLVERGRLAYFLDEAGGISPVYQYVIVTPGLPANIGGEREIIVDLRLGQVAIDRRTARN